jgi:segregation and condensation protein A
LADNSRLGRAGSIAEPLALVRGEPVLELPGDLYIPPDALRVFLDTFEGPLDLLLYLIRRHNLDVLDIPMANLTRQYMEYVEAMRAHQLELAAEYLLMAALLIEIKSRMLLPRPAKLEEGEEDPRAELVRRLLEYEQIKLAGQRLNELPQAGRDFELVHMSRILRSLQHLRFVRFEDLFESQASAPVLVVTFLAILELARESLVKVTQQGAYSPIYVKLNHGLTAV